MVRELYGFLEGPTQIFDENSISLRLFLSELKQNRPSFSDIFFELLRYLQRISKRDFLNIPTRKNLLLETF